METGPSVVILSAAEDEAFIGALAEELVHLDFGYSLCKKDIFCYKVTGTPSDDNHTQLTSTLNLGSVKLVVPVISRHLLGGQSSLTVTLGLETAVRNNKPRYVIWLDQNSDDFRAFGTLVMRQYPMLEAPAKQVQRNSIDWAMPGCVTSRLKAIALNLRDALCRQTGELRLQCLRALTNTGEFLADNMNLKSLLKRLEHENQLRPADVKSINANMTPGRCLIDMLQKRKRQEPYDQLVNILEEDGQGFLVKEMEHCEQLAEKEYGIDRHQGSQYGQQSKRVGHVAQQNKDPHILTKQRDQPDSNTNLDDEQAQSKIMKTVFIGQAMAGKTSLWQSLSRHQPFFHIPVIDRTVGVRVDSFVIHDTENNCVEASIWDFAGQSTYHYVQRVLLTPQALHVLTVDMSRYKSEEFQEQIGTWLTSITSHVTNPAILVVGTKMDMLGDKDVEAACSLIERDIQVAEHSTQTKLREEILLCQMALDAADSGKDVPELFYGLSSQDILAKKESLEKLLDGRPKSLLNVQVIPVSNKTYQGIETLRTKMAEMVKDKNLFPSVQEMPTLWKKLSGLIKGRECTHLQVKDCQYLGASIGMRESDVLKALNHLHMTGQILFYSHIRGMEDMVFPDPTIILTLFKRIFRHDLPGYLDRIAKSLSEHARVQFTKDVMLFLKEGRATKSFLKNVLGDDNIPVFYKLLPLMQHFGLCFGSEIFPTELPAAQPDEIAHCWPEIVASGEEEVSVSIVYSQEPPLGLNETMVSRILSMEQTTCRLLARDTVIIHTEENSEGIMYRHFSTHEEIRIRGELEKAWQRAQVVVRLIDACRDEFPALYLKGSVESKRTARSLTIEAVRQCRTGDLLRMAMGHFKGLLPSVRSMDVVAKNFIDNRLYQVSKALGEGWMRLCQELGLDSSVLDNTPVVGPTQDAFQMLKVWRTRNDHGPLHQLLLLGKTLQTIGRLDQVAVVHEIYKEYWDILKVTPVRPGMTGGTHWSLSLPGEGKYLCTETGLGVVTPCPMHVTYTLASAESTSRLPIARFPWESTVEPVMQPACMLERDLRRNGLCVVFAPANFTRVFQLHVYIISNDVRIVKHLQELEREEGYSSWDPEPCVLKVGEKYHLKVTVRNETNINVLTRPEEGIPFVDTFQTGMYYKKFRVNVNATEHRKGQRSNLEFDLHLSTADHETVCNFNLTKVASGPGKRSPHDDHRGSGPLSTTDALNIEESEG
ncbi:PREDICTED: uncharacterized protein LOC109479406 [Branchiostoma belcheri]|uniref:Uncharacterized protein LOC109479406 n=1 Tax=Branchiostoma belcheri TaxID=7741 RepID=A0A6P4ZJH9_BRABE|nr:PREDICTED: uncharacterized protein LOC109479406 [Branchiostoma belcheri]